MEEIDIWRAAYEVIKQHHDDAIFEATMRADRLLDEGDTAGCSTWIRIARAINVLQGKTRAENEAIN